MGTKLSSIIPSKEISIEDLKGKKLVVDAFNMLYQFLTTIRQRDGSLLTNSKGKVTSHLSGLFFRISKLMKQDIKLAFVFDGKPPELKKQERQRRAEIKKSAERKYQEAVDEGDIELMKKYASRTTKLTHEMIEEAKELIEAFGLPVIDAPSEGEAQAAHMVKNHDFYALISQDTDSIIFGSPRVIKNLSISRKKKVKDKAIYQTSNPEIIELSEVLNQNGVDLDQLIIISILSGTDFNIGGVHGIGPKKGLKLVKKHGKDFDKLFKEVKWEFDFSWKQVYNLIRKMPYTEDYKVKWEPLDKKKIYEIMVEKNEFGEDRIEKSIQDLVKKQSQKGLSEFF
jgi:flap endonuclease-1